MGLNIVIACHKCKEYAWSLRWRENYTIFPFYKHHQDCFLHQAHNRFIGDDQDDETQNFMETYKKVALDPEEENFLKKHSQNKREVNSHA